MGSVLHGARHGQFTRLTGEELSEPQLARQPPTRPCAVEAAAALPRLSAPAGASAGSARTPTTAGSDLLSSDDRRSARAADLCVPCSICLNECVRPVTTPCAHNFCLACLAQWIIAQRADGEEPMCPLGRCGRVQGSVDALRVNLDLQRAQEVLMAQAGLGAGAAGGTD